MTGSRGTSGRTRTACARAALLAVIAVALAAACDSGAGGSGDGEPTPDPGEGSGTLRVTATLGVDEAVGDARRNGDLDTTFTVQVTRSDEPVLDATVVFATPSGDKLLATDEAAADGVYRGSHAGYHRVYDLSVVAGADRLTARIVGPTLHTIGAPTIPREEGTIPPGTAIDIRWDAADTAEAVFVRVGDYTVDELPDNRSHTVPADAALGDEGRELRVEVRREIRMGLAGGAAGSEAVVRVRNRTWPAHLCPAEGCPE